ncbi:hypothetical protein LQV63_03470 [Paenibacillus profundus]|uniref:Uncharacterized protein n=1 Tax=Paenibacillus profundus TaxID=1173085 RepID=A0ABS8Y963_9BACL|nr:hypothetical protein [Paenibacillus profundus]MCE5168373.1 hypothetical protein [Paenibacillus profundus]
MKKYKIMFAVLLTLILFALAVSQSTVLQRATARFTASIYVTFQYYDMDLEFQEVEYAYGFGGYSVRYKDKKSGEAVSLLVESASLPIVVYDSLDTRT